MKAGEVVFQRLLDGKTQYRVPLFQRTCSWKEKHWKRLWDDILKIYALDQPRNHFLGAVVTQSVPDAPERAAKYLLIDGQQRLTTLLILLSAIRQKALASGGAQALASEINETCLINKFAHAPEEKYKLRPTQRDRVPFSAVMEGQESDQKGQIGKAWQYYKAVLEQGGPDDQPLNLAKLTSCITDCLDLVSVTLDQRDSPNRIFESLNNAGMGLGSSDLIRNYIFMRIPNEAEQEQAYERDWFPMQEATGEWLDDFFWRYLMMYNKLPREDETFEGVKGILDGLPDADIPGELLRFSRFSSYYRRLGDPEKNEPDHPIRLQMKRLNDWEVDVAYPVLMQAFHSHATGDVSHEQLLDVLRMIESFVVRRTISGVPTNLLRRIFARMASQVDFTRAVEDVRSYLLENEWPDDTEFAEKLPRFRLYVRARLPRTRLILTSLERSFGHKETPEMGPNITIEHTMPQTLTPAWREMLGLRADEVYYRWLDTVGNLTLSGYNPDLGNKPFEEKKRIFAGLTAELPRSNFALSLDIQACNVWDEQAIIRRGQSLAQRALTIWKR